jgi:ABC-type transport system substrate-binding protein
MRKAISYAFNYSSFTETSPEDDRKAKSPIAERTLYYNVTDINVPFYNVSYARQTLKDANWPGTALLTANGNISVGNEWELIANSSTPLATYNYTHVINWEGTWFLADLFVEDLKQIGVKIEVVNITVWELLSIVYGNKDLINFVYAFWIGDYNDPSTYINTLYSNTSIENWGQVYDPQVQNWMEEALMETDPIKRRNIYYDIQKHYVEEVYPSVWLTYSLRKDIYVSNLGGWYPSAFRFSFKSVYFE